MTALLFLIYGLAKAVCYTRIIERNEKSGQLHKNQKKTYASSHTAAKVGEIPIAAAKKSRIEECIFGNYSNTLSKKRSYITKSTAVSNHENISKQEPAVCYEKLSVDETFFGGEKTRPTRIAPHPGRACVRIVIKYGENIGVFAFYCLKRKPLAWRLEKKGDIAQNTCSGYGTRAQKKENDFALFPTNNEG